MGKSMIEEKYQPVVTYVETGIEAIRRTGIKVLDLRERYGKLGMPMEGNGNHVGMMYAGSLFTIGEVMGGVIFSVGFDYARFYPIVKEVAIKFRRPAMTDVTLEHEMPKHEADRIQKEAEDKGKADFALDLEIKDLNGETVSLVQGVWQIRKIPEGMKGLA
jgi:hypothetical protein